MQPNPLMKTNPTSILVERKLFPSSNNNKTKFEVLTKYSEDIYIL